MFTTSHAQLDLGFSVGLAASSVRPEIIPHPSSSSPCPPHLAHHLARHSAKRGGGSFSKDGSLGVGGSPLYGIANYTTFYGVTTTGFAGPVPEAFSYSQGLSLQLQA